MVRGLCFLLFGLPLIALTLIASTTAMVARLQAADADLIAAPQDGADKTGDATVAAGTKQLTGFSLPATDGRTVGLSADPAIRLHVLCFLGTECPLARVYGPRLQRLADRYADRGVEFLGIVSTVQDSMDDIKAYVDEHGIQFPVLKDYDQQVAVQAGATRTPEMFIVDRDGVIQYQGRIDDQYQPGIARNEAQTHDLQDAIDELLAGKPISKPQQKAVGCLISFPRPQPTDSDVTYCNQVIRILQQNCIECHRAGQIGPFVLDDYDEVVGWGDMSCEVIDQGRMPPWHADPTVGHFANARSMSEEDKQLFRQWVDAGMPYGDANELPPPQTYGQGWRMFKQPDLVLQMSEKPFAVPSEGTVEYQYFVVNPGFTEDKWVRAAQVVPGNNRVVHHCIVFQRPPDGSYLKGAGMLAGYVPGQLSSDLPDGYAYRIVAGASLVFQMHYTPTGKPEEDQTQLGLIFADPDEVTHEVFVINGIDTEFEIPPHTANYPVSAAVDWFPQDGFILSITPHMHVRGKSLELFANSAGNETPLLRVPHYDFNWQHDYDLATPLPLDKVDKLWFRAIFDNSSDNPFNPNPEEYVMWGDQTWEEMALVFLRVAEPRKNHDEASETQSRQQSLAQQRQLQWTLALQFADDYIGRFDNNDDGVLSAHEVPKSVRAFRFQQYDRDDDGFLTRDEMANNALDRYLQATAGGADGRRKF
jgi:peroxiredoxin